MYIYVWDTLSRKKAICNNNIYINYIYIYIYIYKNFMVTYKHYLLIENVPEDTKLLTVIIPRNKSEVTF